VDLIITVLGENEHVLGMDMDKLDHPSDSILVFNEFSNANFKDLLLLLNGLLANNGVFGILKPLWNKHYNDTLPKAMQTNMEVFKPSKPLLASYERLLYTSDSIAYRIWEILSLRRPTVDNPLKKIINLGHPMYKTYLVKNYVQSNNIVKLLYEKRTLRGSRQLASSFYQQVLEILTEPRNAILDLTARTGIFSSAFPSSLPARLVSQCRSSNSRICGTFRRGAWPPRARIGGRS
jgi:hypothetical protein